MADQQGPTAAFPTPPPFYKHFTKANIAHLRQIAPTAATIDSPASPRDASNGDKDIDVLSLPAELRYLIPPPLPSDGQSSAFGQELNLNPREATLEDLNVEQLYPSHPSVRLNPQPHLLALVRSMLLSFLALSGILSQQPELYEEKAQDLRTIVYNMHDLINQYRPHQARHALIALMEERLEDMKGEIKRIDESKAKASKILRSLQDNAMATSIRDEHAQSETYEKLETAATKESRQRAAWASLESGLD